MHARWWVTHSGDTTVKLLGGGPESALTMEPIFVLLTVVYWQVQSSTLGLLDGADVTVEKPESNFPF